MPQKKSYILLAVVILILAVSIDSFPIPAGQPAIADEVERITLLIEEGTDRETVFYIVTAPREGPTVMVIGGVHGDEPAGYLAADIIAQWSIDRGTLLVLPRANIQAVETGTRYPPEARDLNRSFPGNAMGAPTEQLAASIYRLMREFRPHWVVDLHEAQEFERVEPRSLGQTIIYPADAPSLHIIEQVVDELNRTVPEELHQFQVLRGGVEGGTLAAARTLGLEAFATETTRKLPLVVRIDQQLAIVRLFLSTLEVNVCEKEAGIKFFSEHKQ